MTIPYTPIVINTGSKLIVDRHRHGRSQLRAQQGRRAASSTTILKAAGIDRNEVDIVIISHFHGDHINGLIKPDNSPAFPNAEILVPAVEMEILHGRRRDEPADQRAHEGACSPARARCSTRSSARSRNTSRARKWRRASPRSRPTAIRPATRPTWSPRAARRVYVQADVTNHPALFARNPGWHAFFDQDPGHGGGDAPQGLRHAGGGEDDGAGLPLSVPVGRLCREGRLRLSGNSGDVEFPVL